MRLPCSTASVAATKAAMNVDRQNTISQALVIDSWRTRKPPLDQHTAAITMKSMLRRRSWRSRAVAETAAMRAVETG